MADDLELTIVISAIDDASAVLHTLAAEISDDFNAIAAQAQGAETQIDNIFGAVDNLLVAIGQDALAALFSLAQLATAMGSAMDIGGGGGAGPSSDLMGQFAAATPGAAGTVQVIQNNTFNGILDPGAIRDQIIPELERAVTRGATLLTFS